MHCLKTVNIEYDYGTTRIYIFASMIFIVTFCLSYCFTSFNFYGAYTDDYFLIFTIALLFVYPVHKSLHLIPLLILKKKVRTQIRFKFGGIPVIHMIIDDLITRNQYIFALVLPMIIINSALLFAAFTWQQYAHYLCILFAYHCAICLLDVLLIRTIIKAPSTAVIEETEKGYEILVPFK